MSTPTPEQTADDLDAAADILITDGWCQGQYSDEQGRVCALGAIGKAIIGNAYGHLTSDATAEARYQAAIGAVAAYRADSVYGIPEWNDEPGRTEDDVHDLLRNTAKQLRETGA